MFWRKTHPEVLHEGNGVYRVRVRTLKHGDEIEVRFTKAAHIGAAEQGSGYIFRKPLVSSEHFDRGEVAVHFDARYTITATEAQGVVILPLSEWHR